MTLMEIIKDFFRKVEPKPAREPKTIDMRKTTWGHNITIESVRPGYLKGFMWVTPRPYVGDFLVWRTNYGWCRGVIRKCDWTVNVDDMYHIEVEVVFRSVDND